MAEFFSFLKLFMICGTIFFLAMLVLLALPQSRLRSVGVEMGKWALACGLFLMVPSPVDVIPDVVPVVGWADDIAYVVGACAAIKSALNERKKREGLEAIEMEKKTYREKLELAKLRKEAERARVRVNGDASIAATSNNSTET